MKEFALAANQNAWDDKTRFFGGKNLAGPDGCWPDELDWEFMTFAEANVEIPIHTHFHHVETLAGELFRKRKLIQTEIEALILPLKSK
jgi:hypothetical protein